MVVSMPPWGYRLLEPDAPAALRRDPVREVLLVAWSRLAPNGIGAAIMPRNFLLAGSSLFSRLKTLNLFVDISLDLPPGTFAPTTCLGGAIIVVRRGEARPLFCAALSGDAAHDAKVLDNTRLRRAVPDVVTQGILLDPKRYRGLDAAMAEDRLRRLADSSIPEPTPLGELLVSVRMGRTGQSFDTAENAVYLPLIGRSPAHIRLEDLTLTHQNYAQIIVDRSRVSPRWLAGYLSSPVGLQAREVVLTGGFIPRVSQVGLMVLPVYLPSLEEQEAAVEAEQAIRLVREDLAQLGRKVWTNPKTRERFKQFLTPEMQKEPFSAWITRLPLPLASILWAYHAAGNNDKARYEHLLHFFEAAAQFYWTLAIFQ